MALLSVLVYLLAQTTIRPGGRLAVLAGPGVMRVVDPLGSATMGIFGLHALVLLVVNGLGLLGPPVAAWPLLVLRFLVVAVVTTALVLVLRRLPVVRSAL